MDLSLGLAQLRAPDDAALAGVALDRVQIAGASPGVQGLPQARLPVGRALRPQLWLSAESLVHGRMRQDAAHLDDT